MMKQQALFSVSSVALIYLAVSFAVQVLPARGQHQGAPDNNSIARNRTVPGETLLPAGKCRDISSCRARERRLDLDGATESSNHCYCDQKCQLYDDCCHDSPWTEPIGKRMELGQERLRSRRSEWHCRRVNNIFGDILLRSSCHPDWAQQQDDPCQANLIMRRCEYVKDRGKTKRSPAGLGPEADDDQAAQSDPIGMLMPITDIKSGVTFANSYCLRCNILGNQVEAYKRRKLIYWSPLLECNYNTDSDERNTLYDLISVKKGQALRYCRRKNKWVIHMDNNSIQDSPDNKSTNNQSMSSGDNEAGAGSDISKEQRVCTILPTIPDSVEHLIRYCHANLIRTCPTATTTTTSTPNKTVDLMDEENRRAQLECQFGHQAISYSLTSNKAYYNPACAKCNGELRTSCDPKSGRASPGGVRLFGISSASETVETTSATTLGEDSTDEPEGTNSAARANSHETSVSGAFSVLMDLYESTPDETGGDYSANLTAEADNGTVSTGGRTRSCSDPESEVYDPFYLACRDIVCGLNHKFVKGKCVDKFKPAMVYITDVCLIISITSLALYLVLYALSTFDLRPMATQLAQWQLEAETAAAIVAAEAEQQDSSGESSLPHSNNNKPNNTSTWNGRLNGIYRKRHSRASNEGSTASGPTSSSGGAGARQSQSLSTRGVASLAASLLAAYLLFMLGHQTETAIKSQRQPICAGLAAATYYCFLVSFCWMFLLSYDIWRTLRLATCQLRAPAMHSQSARFISYTLLALLVSALLVGLAVLVDQLAPSAAGTWWSHFVQVYRPNFGHQPGSCWFSNRRALALFFGLPVALIMVANLIFFLHSSCMVLRTSSRSSRRLNSSSNKSSASQSANLEANRPKFVSLEKGLTKPTNSTTTTSSVADFTLQNGLTTSSLVSVQTLQSNLSADSSTAPPASEDPARPANQVTGAPDAPPEIVKHAKLDASLSSSSLATNHSACSSSYSIASSLANKCDSHLQSLQSMMGSIMKDYRLYCRLSTIMGLTWLTGLLASLVNYSELLWYLFVVLNTLQGLFIFIAFGCKSSKLSNLELLFKFLKFWLLYRCCCCQQPPTAKANSLDDNQCRPRQDSLSNGADSNGSP